MAKYKNNSTQNEDTLVDATVASPLVISAATLILISFFTGQTFTNSVYLVGFTSLLFSIFAISHFLPELQFDKQHLPYLITYHIGLSFIVIFIMPALSYFLILWVLLSYLSEFYYKKTGLFTSLLILLITLIAGVAYQSKNFQIQNFIQIVPWFIILSGVSLVLSRIILGTKKVRLSLAQKMTKAEYEHQRLLALINSMTEAVVSINESGIINTYNSAALELLNTNSDLENKQISNYIKLFDHDDNKADIISIIGETKYISKLTDFYIRRGDGEKIMLEINVSRAGAATPITHQSGFTLLLRDITKQKTLEEERQDFISVVSHELRTPIAVAEANISMAQLINSKEHPQDSNTISSIDKAHDKILFLSDMVNDLSTLSRAERTDKAMEIETFSVGEILKEMKDFYEEKARIKNLKLKFNTEDDLPKITTSRLYLKEILQNFISNAIKYTPQGSVEVSAGILKNGKVQLAVKDSGVGLSEGDKERVFDKFWRSENTLTRETEGTGLGLYISSKLAKRINADIGVVSKLGSGSMFYVNLPVLATKEIDQSRVVRNEAQNILG